MKDLSSLLFIYCAIQMIILIFYWLYLGYYEPDRIPLVVKIFRNEDLTVFGKITLSTLFIIMCLPAIILTWTLLFVVAGFSWIICKLFIKSNKQDDKKLIPTKLSDLENNDGFKGEEENDNTRNN